MANKPTTKRGRSSSNDFDIGLSHNDVFLEAYSASNLERKWGSPVIM
ncbi:hypothetical protein [Paenibacillus sp. V4I7]|nr:hypothetical protein [Paenibacillus sp. V4I7]MDQ0902918.1 hypothetical protein [Paenibacillus sp. V4I7]